MVVQKHGMEQSIVSGNQMSLGPKASYQPDLQKGSPVKDGLLAPGAFVPTNLIYHHKQQQQAQNVSGAARNMPLPLQSNSSALSMLQAQQLHQEAASFAQSQQQATNQSEYQLERFSHYLSPDSPLLRKKSAKGPGSSS